MFVAIGADNNSLRSPSATLPMSSLDSKKPDLDVPFSPFEQLLTVRELKAQSLEEGDIWYGVSKAWYTQWEDYCLNRPDKSSVYVKKSTGPGPIDNSDITEINPHPGRAYDLSLEHPVVEGDTLEFVPKEAYDLLVRWYVVHRYCT